MQAAPNQQDEVMSDPSSTQLVSRWHSSAIWLLALFASLGCSSPTPLGAPACVVPLGSAPTRGPADAWVTIVEFADFQCAFCGEAESTIRSVDSARPGLRWAFKHFPLKSIHPHAADASLAAECANSQGKFWPMHDQLFMHQGALDPGSLAKYAEAIGLDQSSYQECMESGAGGVRVAADFNQGLAIGVEGTPAFFINGQLLAGAYPASDFVDIIDQVRDIATQSGIAAADYYSIIESKGCRSAD